MQPIIARRPEYTAQRIKTLIALAIEQAKTSPAGAKGVAILTSQRKDKSEHENARNLAELKQKLKTMGLGYKQVIGYGQEEVTDPTTGEAVKDAEGNVTKMTVREPSLVVFGIKLKAAQDLWRMYEQWGIVYVGPETQGEPVLMGWKGSPDAPEDENVRLDGPEVVPIREKKPDNWSEIPKGRGHHDVTQGTGAGFQLPGYHEMPGGIPGYPNPYSVKASSLQPEASLDYDPFAAFFAEAHPPI